MIKNSKEITALFLLGIVVLGCLLLGCVPVQISGSGNIISRTFNFSDFSKIRISSGFAVDVKASSTYRVEVTADDNLFDYLSVKKDGVTLSIGLKTGSYVQTHIQATLLMPGLHGVELFDGSRTQVNGFDSSDALSIKLSDGSNLSGGLTAGNVDITITDGSRVELEDSANAIKVVSHDGSRSDLGDFTAVNADLKIGDGGTLTVDVTGTLNADLSAGSRVNYSGNPTLGNISLSSGSALNKIE